MEKSVFFFSTQLLSRLSCFRFADIRDLVPESEEILESPRLDPSVHLPLRSHDRAYVNIYLPLHDPLNTRRGADHERGGHAFRRGYQRSPPPEPAELYASHTIRTRVSQLCTRRESRMYNGADVAMWVSHSVTCACRACV